jgi:TAT (twin-arginine translocation) pathway signal sequence
MRKDSAKGESRMSDDNRKNPEQKDEDSQTAGTSVTRREFLKIAGIAGAVAGTGAG